MQNRNEKSEKITKVEEFLQSVELIQQTIQNLSEPQPFKDVADVIIETDKPICVVFSSDVHFGSIFTDYKMLTEIWKTVLTTPNVYLMVNGDFIDNFELPVPKLLLAGINSQLIAPALQRKFYIQYLESLVEQNKIIAMTLGNHEEFSSLEAFNQISQKVNVGLNRMLVNLLVGDEEYKIALVHKSRFNSSINPTHSSLRELHLNYPYADVIVTSHTHTPSLQILNYPKSEKGLQNVYLIKTGSLKDKDTYTYKFYNPYSVSDISTPAILFFPDRKKMIGLPDFRDAIKILKVF